MASTAQFPINPRVFSPRELFRAPVVEFTQLTIPLTEELPRQRDPTKRMTHPEPTSIYSIVSENADVLGFCVAGMSSEALRNQVDRATEHLGHVLTPEQLTFIKDMVALLVDGDPLLAQLASRMRSAGVAPLQEAAGNFCEVWPTLSEAAGSFSRVSDACTRQLGAFENPVPLANRWRADVDECNYTCEKRRGATNKRSDTCEKLRGASNECAPLVASSRELLPRVSRKFK